MNYYKYRDLNKTPSGSNKHFKNFQRVLGVTDWLQLINIFLGISFSLTEQMLTEMNFERFFLEGLHYELIIHLKKIKAVKYITQKKL